MKDGFKGTIISIVIALLLAMGGFYVINNHNYGRFDKSTQPEIPLSPKLLEDFETILNDFLKDVDQGILEYKKERKVFVELMRPDNMRTQEYVVQNYEAAIPLAESLQKRRDSIARRFDEADRKVHDLLIEQPQSSSEKILERWDHLMSTQGEFYRQYFQSEKILFSAYMDLMSFYNDTRWQFEVDMKTNEVVFNNHEDAVQEKRLRARIEDIQKKQQELFKKAGGGK